MKLQTLQVGRAVAALMVVSYHLGGTFAADKYFDADVLAQVTRFGSSGVEFFFVLSGFIISHVHARDISRPAALLDYLRRRLVRIFPTYWIVLALVAAAPLFLPIVSDRLPRELDVIVKTVLLLPQDDAVVGHMGAPVLTVSWSLQYELIFYALFAAFIASRRLGTAVLLLAAAAWALFPGSFPLSFMQPHLFLIFAIGVAVASLARHRLLTERPVRWLAVGLGLVAALAAFEVGEMVWRDLDAAPHRYTIVSLGYGLASGVIVFALVAGDHTWRAPHVLVELGGASYVLYLLHYPVISASSKVLTLFGTHPLWAMTCFVGILVLCCWVSLVIHRHFERPGVAWLQGRMAPSPQAAGASP